MSPLSFDDFFRNATGNTPYHYQRRLACGEQNGRAETEWLATGTTCQSQLINIPTGLGKTAAVVLAWLWNRIHFQTQYPPAASFYCQPIRTFGEQTEQSVALWLKNIRDTALKGELRLTSNALSDLLWITGSEVLVCNGQLRKNQRQPE